MDKQPFNPGTDLRPILDRAGVSLALFARLVGASRVAVSLWVNQGVDPRPLYLERIADVAGKIKAAVDDGKLPVATRTPARQRDEAVREIITAK